jgi:5-methylcytosine-specific restriction endonuclease McrA
MPEMETQSHAFISGVPKAVQMLVMKRDEHTCQMCGYAAGDPDPLGRDKKVRLTIGCIIEKSNGGDNSVRNLRTLCDVCDEGLRSLKRRRPPKPDRIHLLTQVRRATIDDQLYVLEWLQTKFKNARGG